MERIPNGKKEYLLCFDVWFASLSKLIPLTFSSEVSELI
jgi:hypothetical protein